MVQLRRRSPLAFALKASINFFLHAWLTDKRKGIAETIGCVRLALYGHSDKALTRGNG